MYEHVLNPMMTMSLTMTNGSHIEGMYVQCSYMYIIHVDLFLQAIFVNGNLLSKSTVADISINSGECISHKLYSWINKTRVSELEVL